MKSSTNGCFSLLFHASSMGGRDTTHHVQHIGALGVFFVKIRRAHFETHPVWMPYKGERLVLLFVFVPWCFCGHNLKEVSSCPLG